MNICIHTTSLTAQRVQKEINTEINYEMRSSRDQTVT